MLAYITLNYKTITDRILSDKKIEEIIGIILAILILFYLASSQEVKMPFKEDAAKDSYILGETTEETGELFAVSGLISEILLPINSSKCDVSTKRLPLEVKEGCSVDFSEVVEPFPECIDLETEDLAAASEETMTALAEMVPVQEDPVDDNGEELSIEVFDGFVCDLSGKIVGCDGLSLTDGVLCLPFDEACTGIAEGAFASLGGQVCEIYIPPNIVSIDPGAFDGLTELMYIEVHPDNPAYGSSCGILFEK